MNMNREERANLCLIIAVLSASIYTLNHALPFTNIIIKSFIFLCFISSLLYVYLKEYKGDRIEQEITSSIDTTR